MLRKFLRNLKGAKKIKTKMNKIINDVEIIVIGMRRSGNHAIINWLIPHYKGQVCFLNNCSPGENPFLTSEKAPLKCDGNFNLEEEKKGNLSKKNCLIYSYEDIDISKVFNKTFKKNHDKWVGKSKKQYIVLILRDPFNLLVSRIMGRYFEKRKMPPKKFFYRKKQLWKIYAREFLKKQNRINKNKIIINYNSWFLSKDYRKSITDKLGLKLNDSRINEVPRIYMGSSFTGTKFNGKANKMKVLERWKFLINNNFYRELINDKELIELSDKIFGKIIDIKKITKTPKFYFIKRYWTKVRMKIMRFNLKVLNFLDEGLGQIGIVLKQNRPKLYFRLKKLKNSRNIKK